MVWWLLDLGAPGGVPTCDSLQAFTAVCKAEQLVRCSLENKQQPSVQATAEGAVGGSLSPLVVRGSSGGGVGPGR